MRICLLGGYSGVPDEAMRKISREVAERLSGKNQVLTLDLKRIYRLSFWQQMRSFSPDIIHYIPGPSIKSFMILRLASIFCGNCKTIMFAVHPDIPYLLREVIRFIQPDLLLVQSYQTDLILRRLGCKTDFFPLGVDIEKFKPVSYETKQNLRIKYGVDTDKFVLLHIGSIKSGRNVQILNKIQKYDCQVLLVGSISVGVDTKLLEELIDSRCIIIDRYIDAIEEVYALADCYIFPTLNSYDHFGRSTAKSIEIPLTVLEAMACNLPVIATSFGGLPYLFQEGNGLIFVEKEVDIHQALELVKKDVTPNTRNMVLKCSWEVLVKQLESVYITLVNDRGVD